MKKAFVILVVLALVAVVVWAGYKYGYKKTVTERVTYTAPVVGTTPSGTPAGENLQTELSKTEDDGGAADFVELQKSAQGL